jgi:hypothetical protein
MSGHQQIYSTVPIIPHPSSLISHTPHKLPPTGPTSHTHSPLLPPSPHLPDARTPSSSTASSSLLCSLQWRPAPLPSIAGAPAPPSGGPRARARGSGFGAPEAGGGRAEAGGVGAAAGFGATGSHPSSACRRCSEGGPLLRRRPWRPRRAHRLPFPPGSGPGGGVETFLESRGSLVSAGPAVAELPHARPVAAPPPPPNTPSPTGSRATRGGGH